MSRTNLILATSLFLSACSITSPYIDRQRNAGEPIETLYSGKSTPTNPAVCYNALTTSVAEVQNLANQECLKQKTGTKAHYTNQTKWSCTLLNPNHIYFKCL